MKTFTFNRDPVDIFWSIPLILFTILYIITNIFIVNKVYYYIDGTWTSGDNWLGIYITFCICTLLLANPEIELIKYTTSSTVIPLWMFASIITIIIIFFYLSITNINYTIRYIFGTSNKSNKSLWKKIILTIIGIK